MKFPTTSVICIVVLILSGIAHSQVTNYVPFPGDTAGFINGRVITRKDYLVMFTDVTKHAPEEKPDSLSEKALLDEHQKTWDQLIEYALIDDSIEKKGIIVSNAEVMTYLESDPPNFLKSQFTDSSGKFDKPQYLLALHDKKNDTTIVQLIKAMKIVMGRQRLSEMFLAAIPPVTDDELWKEYKEGKDATKEKFELEKERLRTIKLQTKVQAYFASWIALAKANAKIIDYRTIK